MRSHLYEFRADRKKLKCGCGWERTLKRADLRGAYARYEEHVAQSKSAAAGRAPKS